MASTTLVTFLLNSVHATATVDVLGSWDNFSRPYPLVKDRQKGHGSWFGCHVFTNIICDGDPANCCVPRNGGLMTGGTYWYYYRRNGNQEFHNPDEPSTTSCPLLPGQTVNVMTIAENPLPRLSISSSGDQTAFNLTLDPEHRFRRPVAASVRPHRSLDRLHSSARTRNPVDARFTHTLARLQTGLGDAVIAAYLQARPTEELFCPRRPGADRHIHSARGRLVRSHHAPMQIKSPVTALQQSPKLRTRPASRVREKTFFGNAVSQPTGPAKNFANPFLTDASAATMMHIAPSKVKISQSRRRNSDTFRPSTWAKSQPFHYANDYLESQSILRLWQRRPKSAPARLTHFHSHKSSTSTNPAHLKQSAATKSEVPPVNLPKSQEHEQTIIGGDWLNQAPVFQQEKAMDPVEMNRIDVTMESDPPTLAGAPPPTRSKSQKLKRFASLKGRIKLPQMSQMPQMPKMKSWRPSTKHGAEEVMDSATVFNEATSAWTPALTSPSESSPTLMSPLIEPMATKPDIEPPGKLHALMLPSASEPLNEDLPLPSKSPPALPKRSFSKRAGTIPNLMDNIVSRKVSQSGKAQESKPLGRATPSYPLRGTSLPTLLTENAYTSSQETIKQTPHVKSPHRVVDSSILLSSRVTGSYGSTQCVPSLVDTPTSFSRASTPSASTNQTANKEPARESFDEEIHRDQIRQIMLSQLAENDHFDGDERRNSFIKHQQQRERSRTVASSSLDSDSDDDFSSQYKAQPVEPPVGFGKGVTRPDAFHVADFDESFDYLADVIF